MLCGFTTEKGCSTAYRFIAKIKMSKHKIRKHDCKNHENGFLRMIKEGKAMAMEINGSLLDYSVKKQNYSSYVVQSMTGNNEASSTKKEDTENKSSLLSQLQDKYSTFGITEGTFSKNQISSQSKGFQGVMISSAYLAKAENNEKTAKELDEMLSGVEAAQKWKENAFKNDGLELISSGYYIDENGQMSSWSVVKKKDSIFDGLSEQSKKMPIG